MPDKPKFSLPVIRSGVLARVDEDNRHVAMLANVEKRLAIPARATASFSSLRRNLQIGLAGTLLLAGGGAVFGAQTVISGAVTTNGSLSVESSPKKVQHLSGGVVRSVNVREGDVVKQGQVLVELDSTVTGANRALIANNLDEQRAKLVRLLAEREDLPQLTFPPELVAGGTADSTLADVLRGEERLFAARKIARDGQRAQLGEQINQAHETIEGLGEQITAKKKEIEFIDRELDGVRSLYAKKLVPMSRVNALERDAARLEGESGALTSNIAAMKQRVAETQLKILQVDQDFRASVNKEVSDTQAQVRELTERLISAQDALSRVEIRSPQDGTVHELKIHTVGGVISPAETLMEIVPRNDTLIAEVKIQPFSIDQVFPTQKATVIFSAFDRAVTPQLTGTLETVSPDLVRDEANRVEYYLARITISKDEIAKLGDLKLVPGMPVEVFIKTADRTILSYLVKPLADQMNRAFRER